MPGSLNRFGSPSRRTSVPILLALSLLACGRARPTRSGEEMRTALSDLAAAEDVYYATNLRYSADQSTIVSLTLPRGVTLDIESADEHGWRASASHDLGIETCSLSGRNDGNSTLAVVEGPVCKPLALGTTLRDVRGRKTAAAASARAIAPASARPDDPAPQASNPSTSTEVISVLLPLAPGAKTEDFGYPTQTVDRLAVRRLLTGRSFDELDRILAAYADSALADYRLEYRLFDAYEAFDVAVPSLEPLLNAWVQRRPKSAPALLARGTFFMASGWQARGESLAQETRLDQFRRMAAFFKRSVADFAAAVALAPNSIVAYRQMIWLARSQGNVNASRNLLDEALKIQPYSYEVRSAHMRSLVPRWGGSYEAMAAFAEESAPFAKRNPRIKALRGFVDWDEGRVAERADRKGDAIEAYNRAIAFGNLSQFRYERGSYFARSDQNADALEDFNAALSQNPQDTDALYERAGVEYDLGQEATGEAKSAYFSQAFRDLALAADLDPANEEFQRRLTFYRENIPEFTPPAPSKDRSRP